MGQLIIRHGDTHFAFDIDGDSTVVSALREIRERFTRDGGLYLTSVGPSGSRVDWISSTAEVTGLLDGELGKDADDLNFTVGVE